MQPCLTVAFVKILVLFSHWIWFLDTQNTFYLMVKGLKNAYLMHFASLPSWHRYRVCFFLQYSSSLSWRVKQRVNICLIINQIQMYPSEKITKHLTVRGGGHYEAILEVPKCENGQKVTKKEAKPGKIVLFMKITSFFVCRKFFFFFKVDTMTYFDDSTI